MSQKKMPIYLSGIWGHHEHESIDNVTETILIQWGELVAECYAQK